MRHLFDPADELLAVPTQLWGPTGNTFALLALDTGAIQTVISWEVAIGLGYDPASATQRVRIITGSAIEYVPEVVFDRIQALGQEKTQFALLCHTLPQGSTVDGVLGLDFIRGMRLVVDFRAGLIELT